VGGRGLLFCDVISPIAAQRTQQLDYGTAHKLNRFQHKGENLITNAVTEI
jgi:hypothetical protein